MSVEDFAYRLLKEKYGISGDQQGHDANHIFAHPSFEEGKLDENTPVLGVSPEEEAIVTITQIILYDIKALYNDQGEVVGASQGSSSINRNAATIANHSITPEELKIILGIEVLLDEQKAIRSGEKRHFYDEIFAKKSKSEIVEDFIDYSSKEYGSYKRMWDSFFKGEALNCELQDMEIRDEILAHSSVQKIVNDSTIQEPNKFSLINDKFTEYCEMYAFTEHWKQSEAKQRYDALKERIDNRDTPCPIFDQALEYYIKRAELIKEQLTEAGYSNMLQLSKNEFDAIPIALFAVTHEKVIQALHEKDPEKWELPSTILQTRTIEHAPPLIKEGALSKQ